MSNDTTAARDARAKQHETRQKSIREQVQEILADPTVNDELKRKLRYTQRSVDGKVPGSNVGLMTEMRAKFIREAGLRFSP